MAPPRRVRSLLARGGRRGRRLAAATALLVAAAGCSASAHTPVIAASGAAAPDPGRPACLSAVPSSSQIAATLALARARLTADIEAIAPGRFPSVTDHAGLWRTSGGGGWTSGFYPGSLWLLVGAGNGGLRAPAARITQTLAPEAAVAHSHDIGFEILTSFGNAYDVTHAEGDRQTILRAAAALATRYDPAVGAVRSWGPVSDQRHFLVIVDGLMNLQLLFWGAQHGGDPAWAQMAVDDALTVRAHFIRPDGSLVHLVDFDPSTGAVLRTANPQAAGPDSTWARGQAWAIDGFARAFGATHDVRFLDAARRTAAYFLSHLPSDCVPYWDFSAPGIPDAPRDSSAAAIAADGLLALSRLEPDSARARADLAAGGGLLAALVGHDLAAHGQALLAHGTPDQPGGSSDVGTSYGDYYFLHALLAYRISMARAAR